MSEQSTACSPQMLWATLLPECGPRRQPTREGEDPCSLAAPKCLRLGTALARILHASAGAILSTRLDRALANNLSAAAAAAASVGVSQAQLFAALAVWHAA